MPGFDRDEAYAARHGTSVPVRNSRFGGPPASTSQYAESEVNGAQSQLMAAIENVSDGFALFDADDRMVFCNRRFREQNPVLALNNLPGMSFEEMLRENIGRGQILDAIGDEEAYIRARLEQHRNPSGPLVQRRGDGRWLEIREARTPDGATLLVNSDITGRKQAEEAMKNSELHLSQAQQLAHLGSWVWDIQTGEEIWSDEQYRILGYEPQEIEATYDRFLDVLHPDDRDMVRKLAKDTINGRAPYSCEYRIVRPDGVVRYLRAQGNLTLSADGQPEKMFGASLDITESKLVEANLRESEVRFTEAARIAKLGHWAFDPETCKHTYISDEMARIHGYSVDEFRDRYSDFQDGFARIHPEDRERYQMAAADAMRRPIDYEHEYRIVRPDGELRYLRYLSHPVFDTHGNVQSFRGVTQDITEHKQAEAALLESEARLSKAAEIAKIGYWVWDEVEEKTIYCSEELAKTYGVASGAELTAEFSSRAAELEWVHPEDRERLVEVGRTAKETKRGYDTEYRIIDAAGEVRHLRLIGEPVLNGRGDLIRSSGITQDITEGKQAEEISRQLLVAINAMNDCVALYDADDRLVFSNERYREVNSAAPESSNPGISFEDQMKILLARGLVPEARGRADAWLRERLEHHRMPKGLFELQRQDGIQLLIHEQRLPEGGTINVATDITERKSVEEQLRQAQKMEAVGQLTAGVAHDFNNMLAVISGNTEMLQNELGEDNPLLAAIYRATRRAANLTARLLAFSRKQVLQPKAIDANKLIADIAALLSRTLEENIDIGVVAAVGLWTCEVDPAQLENAVVNLALNARDAMPGGGKLTLKSANALLDDDYAATQVDVAPGQYIMLTITDTGTGMPAEVRDRAFEPFFTTKAAGSGSGLGLSMVYGFVKQSGGHVTIISKQGEGTTIKLYLPRSTKDETVERKPVTDEVPVARGETVLVVEDDSEVRNLAVAMLRDLGYRIMEAVTAAVALEQMESAAEIDLLLTDVMLPGTMNGRELAAEVERRVPGIQVLYMSAYTEDAIRHHGRLDTGAELLLKPFRRAELAQAVRGALDSPSG